MNGYDLSRNFWNWAFDNPEKISPNHAAIYFFALEHCNRLGDKEKFGFPSQMTMDAVGIKKHQTYIKYFNDLIRYGFFKLIQKSQNQYSANIISLVNALPKKGKALDKAIIKHRAKQMETNGQSKDSIVKPINKETITKVYSYTLEREILNSVASLFESKYYNTEPKKQKWLDEIRKLISIDGETKQTIIDVIKFARKDKFWSTNLLSINSLRNKNNSGVTKYDQIKAKMPSTIEISFGKYKKLTEQEKKDRNVNINWTYVHVNSDYKKVHEDERGNYIEINKERVYL